MLSASPTKPEIIAIAISKLEAHEPRSSCTFCDVGCGTGAVSIADTKAQGGDRC